jgi:RNA polymerase sigma-70 factor (sigma-E family)
MTRIKDEARDRDFADFFQARGPGLRRIAFLILHDWQLAEDVTQQAMLKVYVHWGRSDEQRRFAFARRILVRECLSLLRRKKPEFLRADPPDVPDIAPDPESRSASRAGLLHRIQDLAPQQRAVIALRAYEDLPVAEVATLLGISEGTVKSQTSRALTRLRQDPEHQQAIRGDSHDR